MCLFHATVFKSGDGLAVTIPHQMCKKFKIRRGSKVGIDLTEDRKAFKVVNESNTKKGC